MYNTYMPTMLCGAKLERHQCFAESLTGNEKGGSCPVNCPDWLVKFLGQISGCASHDTDGMPCAKCQHACEILVGFVHL